MARRKKYRALSLVSVWLCVIGVLWLIGTIAVIAFLLLTGPMGWISAVIAAVYGVPASVMTIACSQLIDLLIDCEEHLSRISARPH